MKTLNNNEILEAILQQCIVKDEKMFLTCEIAFKIAKEMDVSISNIGLLCNENDIRIKNCQVGCF